MRPTERSARKPYLETGFLATLRGLLHAQGSGVPWRPRALTMVATLATALGALAFMSGPALAAPEAPQTLAPAFTASSATLVGVLNPGKEGGPGTYEIDTYRFLYKKSGTECAGESASPEGLALGGGQERVEQAVAGLEPGTEYTVCLLVRYGAEEALSPPVTFKTAIPPEAPETLEAKPVTGSTATLHGVLYPAKPGEPGEYVFFYRASSSTCEGGEASGGAAAGAKEEHVETTVGLQPDTRYTVCLAAVNKVGEEAVGPPVTLTTPGVAPTVGGASVVSVSASEATVAAQIDSGGAQTGYRVQYVSDAQFKESAFARPSEMPAPPSAEASSGGGSAPVEVRQTLGDLQAGTIYHVRFVASNDLQTGVSGEEATFATPASTGPSSSVLPDDRAYELVSSPTSNANVYPPNQFPLNEERVRPNATHFLVRAAAGGDGVVYQSDPPPSEGGASLGGTNTGNAYIAKRGPEGWTQTLLQLSGGLAYEGFSSELSVGVFNPELFGLPERYRIPSAAPAEPPNCELDSLFSYTSSDGGVHSLVGSTPTQAPTNCRGEFAGGNEGTAAVPQYSHILLQSENLLTPEAVPPSAGNAYDLYDSVANKLHLISLLPNGEAAVDARFVGPEEEQDSSFTGGSTAGSPNGVSADGSRVFWTTTGSPTALYVRENDAQPPSPLVKGQCAVAGDACTVQIDAKQEGAEGESGGGVFWAASSDGSRVLFTDESRLTVGATAAPGEPDLYEYELNAEAGKPGRLTDLTVDGGGEHANVLGVMGASEDARYAYFVALGRLTSAVNAEGTKPVAGQPNLYMWHEGAIAFIATANVESERLEAADSVVGDVLLSAGRRSAEVTPDGGSLVFRSTTSLTGYANGGLPEVFVYDRDAGRLSCASCAPSGAPPVGGVYPYGYGAYLTVSEDSDFALRWISEDGARVFYVTGQPLVAQDVNGLQDVYEWERPASGAEPNNSCTTSSLSYSNVNGGCVYLLSGGTSSDYSYFLDASANGDDVFFRSRAKLAPRSVNENMAVYDARVGGGFPETRVACTGTGCQGVPPAAPIFATPASVTFNGVGNYPPPPVQSVAKKKSLRCANGKRPSGGKKCVKRRAHARKVARKRTKKNGRGS
jgi:hypothetical protein